MTLSVDEIIKSIEKLPAAEQERVRQWLEDEGAKNGEGHGSQAHANRSSKSLKMVTRKPGKILRAMGRSGRRPLDGQRADGERSVL